MTASQVQENTLLLKLHFEELEFPKSVFKGKVEDYMFGGWHCDLRQRENC